MLVCEKVLSLSAATLFCPYYDILALIVVTDCDFNCNYAGNEMLLL
eukprot:SAG31_NODE_41561_length_275_cov_0.931818_1_plen_45_part_10